MPRALNIMYLCLIPMTRPNSIDLATASAELDGWTVLIEKDDDIVSRAGSNVVRERLLDQALLLDPTLIRYMDDDDILLSHLSTIRDAFASDPTLDIVYTKCIINGITETILSGDPIKDASVLFPWSWVARTSALIRVKELTGYVWNPNKHCRQGGWCWYNFLQCNLNIKYIPIVSYNWQRNSPGSHVSKHSDFWVENKLLLTALKQIK